MKARRFVGLLLIVAALAIVGILDKQTGDAEQTEYCNNVRDGLWPDFHETFKTECGGKEPPKFNANLTK